MGADITSQIITITDEQKCIYKGQHRQNMPHGHGYLECPAEVGSVMYNGEWEYGKF